MEAFQPGAGVALGPGLGQPCGRHGLGVAGAGRALPQGPQEGVDELAVRESQILLGPVPE
jgi:hypothetical protein